MEQHSEILPRLAAFHDGQLTASERLEIEAHLEHCSECRLRLSDWQLLDRALATIPVPDAPGQLHWRTRKALAEATGSSERPRRVPTRFWYAVAAVFVLAFTGALMWKAQEPEVQVAESLITPDEAAKPETPVAQEAPAANAVSPDPSMLDSRDLAVQSPAGAAQMDLTENPTASGLVGTGDTGIPQLSDWPARLTDAEWRSLDKLRVNLRTRIPEYVAPLEVAEINLMPLFDDAFVAVGYKPLADPLNPGHEAAYSDPVLLTPETAYLVSNLRLEQTSLWARSQEEAPSADEVLQLAEISWRLANLTADRDDVKGAIAAHTLAMQQRPEWAAAARSRITALQALDKP